MSRGSTSHTSPYLLMMVGYAGERMNFFYGSPTFTGRVFIDLALSGFQGNMKPSSISRILFMEQVGQQYMVNITRYRNRVHSFGLSPYYKLQYNSLKGFEHTSPRLVTGLTRGWSPEPDNHSPNLASYIPLPNIR